MSNGLSEKLSVINAGYGRSSTPNRIAIIGAGFVGMATAIQLTLLGNQTIDIIEKDLGKMRALKEGSFQYGDLTLDGHYQCIPFEYASQPSGDYDFIFYCVDTNPDSKPIHTRIYENLLPYNKVNPCSLIIRSTIPVGTARRIQDALFKWNVFFMPEFLQEGRALFAEHAPQFGEYVGAMCRSDTDKLQPIIKSRSEFLSYETAELWKLGANAMLAVKLSAVNEIGHLAKYHGANLSDLGKLLTRDPRTGNGMTKAGFGFGGSCLPKDLEMLVRQSEVDTGRKPGVLSETLATNHQVVEDCVQYIIRKITTDGIIFHGIGFKMGSATIRNSPVYLIAKELQKMALRMYWCDDNISEVPCEGVFNKHNRIGTSQLDNLEAVTIVNCICKENLDHPVFPVVNLNHWIAGD